MTTQNTGKAILEDAYQLQTPADNIRYYDRLAALYDNQFALDMGWSYPQAIADIYTEQASAQNLPIADIGCGTGLIADFLEVSVESIEGFDISAEMLSLAAAKQTYGRLAQVDLTQSLDEFKSRFGAVISAGTFTHGHLGPQDLANLLAIGRPGCLFVIGVNKAHYRDLAFAEEIDELYANRLICAVDIREISMYSNTGHDHSADTALVLIFRKY